MMSKCQFFSPSPPPFPPPHHPPSQERTTSQPKSNHRESHGQRRRLLQCWFKVCNHREVNRHSLYLFCTCPWRAPSLSAARWAHLSSWTAECQEEKHRPGSGWRPQLRKLNDLPHTIQIEQRQNQGWYSKTDCPGNSLDSVVSLLRARGSTPDWGTKFLQTAWGD